MFSLLITHYLLCGCVAMLALMENTAIDTAIAYYCPNPFSGGGWGYLRAAVLLLFWANDNFILESCK